VRRRGTNEDQSAHGFAVLVVLALISVVTIPSRVAATSIDSQCGSVCDGRTCEPTCFDTLFGPVLGTGFCTGTSNACSCELFECDPCGNSFVDGREQCDNGTVCLGGLDSGLSCTSFFDCPGGECQTVGGEGCAENCTSETQVTTDVGPTAISIQGGQSGASVLIDAHISFAEGSPKNPPLPPCRPVAIRSLKSVPMALPQGGCFCAEGVVSSDRYGPGNVGIGVLGCADAPRTLAADLTLRTWVVVPGCEPGQPDDGPDGQPCTMDDPARNSAATFDASLSLMGTCVGDCNSDQMVTVDELIVLIDIARGESPLSACTAGDINQDHVITVDEIVSAVRRALNGCGLGGALTLNSFAAKKR